MNKTHKDYKILVSQVWQHGIPKPAKPKKPGVLQHRFSGLCRKCGYPTKPQYRSARNLTRFETSTCKDTEQNKKMFDIERKYTYCTDKVCTRRPAENPSYTAFMDLAEDYYGTRELTRKQKRAFSKILQAEMAC